MKRIGKILGIALGPAGALIAEVAGGDAPKVSRLAEFRYPDGVGIEQPAELGRALAAFLKEKGISERDAAIGLPAKWLVTRRKEIPPASPALAAASLRLQAETEFSNERDLIVDYAGDAKSSASAKVLLVATARSIVDQCAAMAKAAGLKISVLTATGAALARVGAHDFAGVVVSVSSAGVELVVQSDGTATQLRHLSVGETAEAAAPLAGEIRRAMLGIAQNEQSSDILLWHKNGDTLGEDLGTRLGRSVKLPELSTLAAGIAGDGRYAPAVAVAVAGLRRAPVDFLHSRLAPPPVKTNRRFLIYGILAGVLAIGAIAYCIVDLQQRQDDLTLLQNKIKSGKPIFEQDKILTARLRTAEAALTGTPLYTACFKDLTDMFPYNVAIYATNLTLHPEAQKSDKPAGKETDPGRTIAGELTFKTRERAAGDALYEKIREHPKFTEVRMPSMTENKTTGEVSRTVSFKYYADAETAPAATAPAAAPATQGGR